MARKAKALARVEVNPSVQAANKWNVYGASSGSVIVNADELDVTETGVLVFLVANVPVYVIPAGTYKFVQKI